MINSPGSIAPADRPPVRGLGDLAKVSLADKARRLFERAAGACYGGAVYRARKQADTLSLFQLQALAPAGRLVITSCDLEQTLRVSVQLEVPVPCMEGGDFCVRRGAWIGIQYPEEAISHALPGYAFMTVLLPQGVWHPNVGNLDSGRQPLCLGASLPAGIPLVELILAAYGALSLQAVTLDWADPAGVLNVKAAEWWQANRHRIPLTSVPFLVPD
jgi:hypothetical protein